jgi:acyl transferase domain-containing protein
MSCRFPGVNDAAEFWENLRTGVESISFFSPADFLRALRKMLRKRRSRKYYLLVSARKPE